MIFNRKTKSKLPPDMNPDELVNYNYNDLLDELHERFFESYAKTLDTVHYVPKMYINRVYKQIYKGQKKMYKVVVKIDKIYQKWYRARLLGVPIDRQQEASDNTIHDQTKE